MQRHVNVIKGDEVMIINKKYLVEQTVIYQRFIFMRNDDEFVYTSGMNNIFI